jgi:flavin reductase (DIM6/NTAB) family NADH-FMN oxidoreductase RutF
MSPGERVPWTFVSLVARTAGAYKGSRLRLKDARGVRRAERNRGMKKIKIGDFDAFAETMSALSRQGALLVAGAEPVNPMTIGWAQMGIIWGRPIFTVLVRPSRFTHGLMEKADAFSVNVPSESLSEACALCGSRSGRDTDKMKEAGLTAEPGTALDVPTIAECPIHYECEIVHKNAVDRAALARGVIAANYGGGDFHTIYWGEIKGVFKRA